MRKISRGIPPWVYCAVLLSNTVVSGVRANEIEDERGDSRNKLELFVGMTHHRNETDRSLGFTYEYRATQVLGFGGLIEYTSDADSWVWAVPLFIHPVERWRFTVAPGLERAGSENELLFRVGAGYEWELGRWSVAPELNFDFVDGETNEVYGISIGRQF